MTDLFINLLFGHFIGDFFLQPKNMAVKKGASNLVAFLHVLIYTIAVLSFTVPFCFHDFNLKSYYLWVFIIFVPHYLIDRYSLADKWLNLINGRSLEDFYWHGHKNIPSAFDLEKAINFKEEDRATKSNYHILRGGFTCVVYVVVDNVTHLICLWYGAKLIPELS